MNWPQDARNFCRKGHTGAQVMFPSKGCQFKNSGRFLAVATVFGKLVAKGANADLEELGGLGAVAVCALEGFEDSAFFEFMKGHDLRIGKTHRQGRCQGGRCHLCGRNGNGGRDSHEFGTDRNALLSKNGGTLDNILKLTHISRPVVGNQTSHTALGEPTAFDPMFFGKSIEEVVGEDLHIAGAFAERRDLDGENIEAVVEILTEVAFLNGLEQVAVRCRKDAHIDFDGFISPHPLEFTLLEDSQKFGGRVRFH